MGFSEKYVLAKLYILLALRHSMDVVNLKALTLE